MNNYDSKRFRDRIQNDARIYDKFKDRIKSYYDVKIGSKIIELIPIRASFLIHLKNNISPIVKLNDGDGVLSCAGYSSDGKYAFIFEISEKSENINQNKHITNEILIISLTNRYRVFAKVSNFLKLKKFLNDYNITNLYALTISKRTKDFIKNYS